MTGEISKQNRVKETRILIFIMYTEMWISRFLYVCVDATPWIWSNLGHCNPCKCSRCECITSVHACRVVWVSSGHLLDVGVERGQRHGEGGCDTWGDGTEKLSCSPGLLRRPLFFNYMTSKSAWRQPSQWCGTGHWHTHRGTRKRTKRGWQQQTNNSTAAHTVRRFTEPPEKMQLASKAT